MLFFLIPPFGYATSPEVKYIEKYKLSKDITKPWREISYPVSFFWLFELKLQTS